MPCYPPFATSDTVCTRPTLTQRGATLALIHIRHRNLLRGLQMGDDWLRKVCWDNPVALFGLPETVG